MRPNILGFQSVDRAQCKRVNLMEFRVVRSKALLKCFNGCEIELIADRINNGSSYPSLLVDCRRTNIDGLVLLQEPFTIIKGRGYMALVISFMGD